MATVILRDEVWRHGVIKYHDGDSVRFKYLCKEKLEAKRCDICEKVFSVPKGHLIYEGKCIVSLVGLGVRDEFAFDVCSIGCGQEIVDGAYDRLVRVRDQKRIEEDEARATAIEGLGPIVARFPIDAAKLEYHRLCVGNVLDEKELIHNWEVTEQKPPIHQHGTKPEFGKAYISLEGRDKISLVQDNE